MKQGRGELATDPGARRDAGRVRAYGAGQATSTAPGSWRCSVAADATLVAGGMVGRPPPAAAVAVASAPIDPSLVDVADAGAGLAPGLANFSPAQAALFTHCSLASGVVPSAAWRKRTAELVATDDARDMVHGMLDDTMVAAHHQTYRTYQYEGREYRVWNPAIVEANVALVRGAM